MQPLSQRLLTVFPAGIGALLVLLCAVPLSGGMVTYTPNVAWLMTIVMMAFYPPAWPMTAAFSLGLLQDVLFVTPLGSQALLSVLLAQVTGLQAARQQSQQFRLRWLEAAGVLVLWHGLLWVLMRAVTQDSGSLRHLLQAGLVDALWYPLFYGVITRAFAALPHAK